MSQDIEITPETTPETTEQRLARRAESAKNHTSVADAYRENLQLAIREAILAERERCAKIADGYATSADISAARTGKFIAETIRRGRG